MKLHVAIAIHPYSGRYHIVLPINGVDIWSETIRKTMCGSIEYFKKPFSKPAMINRLLHNEELCGECRYQYNKKIKDEVRKNEKALSLVVNYFLNCIYDHAPDNVVDIMRKRSSR